MKAVILLVLSGILFTGCATGPVIGPFSYMTAEANKKTLIRRAALRSQKLSSEQKAKVFHATSFSSQPNEIAVAVGVDMFELVSGDHTWGDIFKQLGGLSGDLVLYGALGYAVQEYTKGDNNDNENNDRRVTVDGDNNNVNVTQGDENRGTSSGNKNASSDSTNENTDEGL